MAQSTEKNGGDAPASTPSSTGRRWGRGLVWGWSIGLIAHAAILGFVDLGDRATSIVNDIAWTVAALLAAISSLRAARYLHGRDRLAWLLFAAACTCWTLGQLIWNAYEVVLNVAIPFPSYADIGYLAFGPFLVAGLFVLRTTQRERRLNWLRITNLSLILCSLAVVLVVTLTQPFQEPQQTLATTFIVVSENVTIAVAFILGIYFLWSYRWEHRLASVTLLTLSFGAQMVAGMLYARELAIEAYGPTSFINIGWVMAFALHQAAAELQIDTPADHVAQSTERDRHEWVELLIPSFLMLCIAASGFALADEITARMTQVGAVLLSVFALILGARESWLYSQSRRMRTRMHRSSVALKESRERLAELELRRDELTRTIEMTARAGGVGLWEWDIQTNVVHMSPEWKRQLGYEDEELPDRFDEWTRRLHPDDREMVRAALAAYLANPVGEYASEQRLQHRDGSYRWVLTRGTMLFDGAGRKLQMLGSQVDITVFKDLERSLRASEARYRDLAEALEQRVVQRTQELTEAYRESQNFAYAVAHDLKAPLRAIDGFNALLLESAGDRLTDADRRLIDKARGGAIRMASLIDGLLNYSRVEHREQRVVPVDCRECVDAVLQEMSDAIQDAEVRVDLDDTPVMADREALTIVLRNLLDNALKFARPDAVPRIDISSSVSEGNYVLRIQDNGIGFEAVYRDKIFKIFERLHASGYSGTGIGLALVRKAVHRMQGSVWAESEPGAGSTFYVSLSAATSALEDAIEPDAQA